mgnify:CR=1 FL=1
MFMPGKQVWSDNPTDPETVKWCERYNDEAMSKLLLSFLGNDREQTQKITPYYAEIANKAKIVLVQKNFRAFLFNFTNFKHRFLLPCLAHCFPLRQYREDAASWVQNKLNK